MSNEQQQEIKVPIEEIAMLSFEKDMEIANLRKQVKELTQQINFLQSQTNVKPTQDKKMNVMPEMKQKE